MVLKWGNSIDKRHHTNIMKYDVGNAARLFIENFRMKIFMEKFRMKKLTLKCL